MNPAIQSCRPSDVQTFSDLLHCACACACVHVKSLGKWSEWSVMVCFVLCFIGSLHSYVGVLLGPQTSAWESNVCRLDLQIEVVHGLPFLGVPLKDSGRLLVDLESLSFVATSQHAHPSALGSRCAIANLGP